MKFIPGFIAVVSWHNVQFTWLPSPIIHPYACPKTSTPKHHPNTKQHSNTNHHSNANDSITRKTDLNRLMQRLLPSILYTHYLPYLNAIKAHQSLAKVGLLTWKRVCLAGERVGDMMVRLVHLGILFVPSTVIMAMPLIFFKGIGLLFGRKAKDTSDHSTDTHKGSNIAGSEKAMDVGPVTESKAETLRISDSKTSETVWE